MPLPKIPEQIPEGASGMTISFGPEVSIHWPSLDTSGEDTQGDAWMKWDVWDRRGHTQGAHRIVTGVLYERALAVARQSMDLSAKAALDAVRGSEGWRE